MITKCSICSAEVEEGKLGRHVWDKHKIKAFDYAVSYLGHSVNPPLCVCGCQERIKGRWGGLQRGWSEYKSGHDKRWRSDEDKVKTWANNISITIKENYASGKTTHHFLGYTKETHPGLKTTSKKLLGNTIGEEHKKQISTTLKRRYQENELKTWNKGLNKYNHVSLMKLSKSMVGKKHSSQTKEKLSVIVTNHHKENPYTAERREKIRKWMTALGKKKLLWTQSIEGKSILSKRLSKRNAEGKMAVWRFPTKPEQSVLDWFPEDLIYTGNGTYWVTFNGKHKNPDFHCKGNKNKIIEVFGEYWHPKEHEQEYIKGYASINKKCIVLWQYDIDNKSEEVKQRIISFINED